MNKQDLLNQAIESYVVFQSMNSFCVEAITEANVDDAQKLPLDFYSKLLPIFESEPSKINEICAQIQIFARLNINMFINKISKSLDEEDAKKFVEKARKIILKKSDKNNNFLFTTEVYFDIMKIYWDFEHLTVRRRFENGTK